jgi:hypothetical protein
MAVSAVSASCHIQYSFPVHHSYLTYLSSEASLQLFCRNASLFHTCTESEDSHV